MKYINLTIEEVLTDFKDEIENSDNPKLYNFINYFNTLPQIEQHILSLYIELQSYRKVSEELNISHEKTRLILLTILTDIKTKYIK